MENINKEGNLNSRIVTLNKAYQSGDTKTVRLIIDSIKAKKDYYDTVSVESLREQVENYEDRLYGSNAAVGVEREAINAEIIALREQIVEKRDFIKNKELIDEICSENLSNLLPEESNRIKRNRVIKGAVATATVIAIIALGAKGCSNSKKNESESTTATTIVNVITENGDETISASEEYENEETNGIEPIGTVDPYEIDPLIGTGITNNNNSNSNNNGGGNSSSTSATTGSITTTQTSATSPTFIIPDTSTTVSITYDPDGNPLPITWPTTETTIPNPVIPDTTPTGTDPLPIEPTVIVLPTPTNTPAPTSTPQPTPTSAPTPAIPTGTIPGETPDVTPTPIPVPTNVPVPATPTPIPEPEPTSGILPPIPTGDVDGEEDIEYNKNFTGNKPAYVEEIRNIPDPINYVETRNIPGVTTIEHTYFNEAGYTEEIRNIPDPINHVETRDIPGETYIEHDYFTGKARSLRK